VLSSPYLLTRVVRGGNFAYSYSRIYCTAEADHVLRLSAVLRTRGVCF
jgi:hypothetical protein